MDSRRWRVIGAVVVFLSLALGIVLAAAERPGPAWGLIIGALLASATYWADFLLRRRYLPPAG